MTTVTPQDVWDAMNRDPEFLIEPDAMRKATRPFIEALPVILEDMLDAPVTLKSLLAAKIKFLRYLKESDFLEVTVNLSLDQQEKFSLTADERDELIEDMREMVGMAADLMESVAPDVYAHYHKNGVTEAQLILSDESSLSLEARTLYQAGKLTIGRLLIVQPMAITKNSKM